jgi:hypothetical protein
MFYFLGEQPIDPLFVCHHSVSPLACRHAAHERLDIFAFLVEFPTAGQIPPTQAVDQGIAHSPE